MARLSAENEARARELISFYPRPRSAMLPLLHLAQGQDGYVTDEAMHHIAELVDATPAEVLGTATFYEMFAFEPTGRYVIDVCTNISCLLLGGTELLEHLAQRLGVTVGGTTPDGLFTLHDVECIAACTEAPCLQVNSRYRLRVSHDDADALIEDLRAGRLDDEIPRHGVLARVGQHIPDERRAGIVAPEAAREAPVWLARNDDDGVEES